MKKRRVSERKMILLTAILLIISGLLQLISYRIGVRMFYFSFAPLLLYRFWYYLTNWRRISAIDRYRRYTFGLMVITIILNLEGIQNAEFFLLILLAVDYLIVSRSGNNGNKPAK